MTTESIDIYQDVVKSGSVRSVPKEDQLKFLYRFFKNDIPNCTYSITNNIHTAIIDLGDISAKEKLDEINSLFYKKYNKFIEEEFEVDPKFWDRNFTYESEVKNNKLIIRWV